jgi:DUF4097 and DUF4098 domain-containing protein YvlB
MYTFETPGPVSVTVELGVGDVRVVASERTDTVVEIRPSDSARRSHVHAAEQTRVEYSDGRLLVRAPKTWRHTIWGGGESIDVEIGVPSGSQLQGDAAVASVHCVGRLGTCHFKTSAGNIDVEQAGGVRLRSSVGDIAVQHAVGDAELATSSGALRIDRVDGNAVVKNSNGDTWIGEITGDLRVNSANGSIAVDHARATVVAKTANGDVRLREVARGSVLAETSRGRVEIGVLDGVAAWLDLKTQFGKVRNNLDASTEPEPGEDTVEVRARTSFGDITVDRSGRTIRT